MEKRADLHIHTKYSDGSFTPEETVQTAKKQGLACISITDHDSVSGLDEAIATGEALDVEIVPGVEVSAEYNDKEMHILGYCIDRKDDGLLQFLSKIRQDRRGRLFKMVEALNDHGLSMDAEDILNYTGDVSISRLHIAQYMESKGLVSSWREAFKKYIGDTQPCYISSFRYTPKQVIDAIKNAGGVAVIAHPGFDKLENVISELIADGIDGIEVYHTEHSVSVSRKYEEYAKENNLLITGGSDCHGMLKGKLLMGSVSVPYACVEALKKRVSVNN